MLNLLLFAILAIAPQSVDLADLYAAKAELQLVRDNLPNSTLALAHAAHAGEHIMIEDLAALQADIRTDLQAAERRIDRIDAMLNEAVKSETNSTIMALALEGIVRDSMSHYEAAVGEEEHDGPAEILSVTDYQSAKALVSQARELFAELRPLAPASAKNDIMDLDFGLKQLENFMDLRVDAHGVEDVAHEHVLNSLYQAFGISATPEFGAHMLAAVAVALAVAGIRVARRRL